MICETNNEADMREAMHELGLRALRASRALAVADPVSRTRWLLAMADALERDTEIILAANAEDLAEAKQNGLDAPKLERLTLTPKRVKDVADALRHVAGLDDPVGRILSSVTRPNGLRIDKVSVPIGVIAIIYESRPNVTVDAAGLCIKSGNAVILRGGKEAFRSNSALAKCISDAGVAAGMP